MIIESKICPFCGGSDLVVMEDGVLVPAATVRHECTNNYFGQHRCVRCGGTLPARGRYCSSCADILTLGEPPLFIVAD